MASTKKTAVKNTATKKVAAKKTTANKTPAKKAAASKVTAKKPAVAKKPVAKIVADNQPTVKKGSKLACRVCGFAITVDNISGVVEEALLLCCDTPMHHRKVAVKKK